ncbi:MAG TPA: phage terminase large subunit family protein [Gemmatimonadales bacterium]
MSTVTALIELERAFADGLEWEPELGVAEWSDRHRMLSSKASAEPGQWRTSRTPYLREIMDELSTLSPVKRVVFMKGAQVGATECGNNWIGYVIHHAPAPFLMVTPTVELAKRASKQRIAPMIEATPVLRERVSPSRARDAGNTTFVKEFDGGLLILTGANSGAGLRSMPIRDLFCDEVDEYPGDVDAQGDPVSLAEKRTITFARRKIFLVSTPTLKGLSRIEREFEASDQRRYYVPCPFCGHMDWIRWENIRFEEHQPKTARLACTACNALIEERHKTDMLAGGVWRATAQSETAGFHLSGLYSPLGWKSWAECVEELLSSKDDRHRLKTWINTVLGETWEELGDSIDVGSLAARREVYPAEVPDGVGALVAAVDVQGDRLEVTVKGYGHAEESWLIAWTQLYGDPGLEEVWRELDAFLGQPWTCASGQQHMLDGTFIDSGGLHTDQVYRYVRSRMPGDFTRPKVFAIKGGNVQGAPLVPLRPTTTNRYRLPLYVLGVFAGKDMAMARLRIPSPGPGFVHLPEWIDEEYLSQLTAEKAIRKYVKGKGSVREWVKIRDRNEAFDLEVYALAGLHILGPALMKQLRERAARWMVPVEGPRPDPKPNEPTVRQTPPTVQTRPRRGGGWIHRF